MAQLMPLLLTVSCFSKIQLGFTFLVPAHPGSPRHRALNGCSNLTYPIISIIDCSSSSDCVFCCQMERSRLKEEQEKRLQDERTKFIEKTKNLLIFQPVEEDKPKKSTAPVKVLSSLPDLCQWLSQYSHVHTRLAFSQLGAVAYSWVPCIEIKETGVSLGRRSLYSLQCHQRTAILLLQLLQGC